MKKNRKKTNKKVHVFLIFSTLFLLSIIFCLKITENGTYTILDCSTAEATPIKTYHHFLFAKLKLDSLSNHNSLCIQNEDGKVIALQEGLVNLHTKDISENTPYIEDATGKEGYLNGSYGTDALYIKTNPSGTKVLAMISGVKAWFNIEDIQLYFFNDSLSVSSYTNINNTLVHSISNDLLNGYYSNYGIGVAPKFTEQGKTYYSYDGNWFYTNLSNLSNDTKNNTHSLAVNKKPFFNFYQYVPHRSASTISYKELDHFLTSFKGINSKAKTYPCLENESALYKSGKFFIEAQNEYSINSTMMYTLALNESGFGQSQYSIENNNFFGHAVYDSNPDAANSYKSLKDCLNQHAYNFIQQGFANPNDERYHGSWFGNKGSGINVSYASDPYWGEKAAYFYYQIDSQNNLKDFKSIPIHTEIVKNDISIYSDKHMKHILYTYHKGSVLSYVIDAKNKKIITLQSEVPIQNYKIDINKIYKEDKAYIKTKSK